MRHSGFVPPWTDKNSRYGWWKNVGELWDGGWVWELQPPRGPYAALLDFYLPSIQAQLNEELLLIELAKRPAV